MKFLLKLKSWQLFMLAWGLPILSSVFTILNPVLSLKLMVIMMIPMLVGYYGWIWAIAITFSDRLQNKNGLNQHTFQALFAIPIIYILVILIALNKVILTGEPFGEFSRSLTVIMVLTHLVSMAIMLWAMRFAAIALKSVELKRHARFSDYAAEFFLIWFSIIGIWILQPRINKLMNELTNDTA